MLIDEGHSEDEGDKEESKEMTGSQIKYFQSKNSPSRSNLQDSQKKESRLKQTGNNSGSEIKKLL